MDTSKRRIAINRYILIAPAIGAFLGWIGMALLSDREIAAGIVSILLAVILFWVAPVLLPIYYCFDEEGITFRYLFLPQERYLWKKVRSITVSYERRGPTVFELDSRPEGKKRFYMDGKIPKNGRTRRLLEAYWDGAITGYLFEGLHNWLHRRDQDRKSRQLLTDEVVSMEREARAQTRTALALYDARAAQLGLQLHTKFCYLTDDLDEQNSRPDGSYTYTVVVDLCRPDETDEDRIIVTGADLVHVRPGRNAYRGVPDKEALDELSQELAEILDDVQKHGLDAYCQENQ